MMNYPDYSVNKVSSLLEMLRNSVYLYGDQTVFCRKDKVTTYHQFETSVLRVVSSLNSYRNQYIGLVAKDPQMFAIGFFAVVLTGNIAVLLNNFNNEKDKLLPPIVVFLTDEELREREKYPIAKYDMLPCLNVEKVCTIIYSSGTMSASKGIMLSQKNLCSNVVAGLEKYQFVAGDRLLQLIPYYHAFGLVCDMLAPIMSGCVICILEDKAYFLSQMSIFQPTVLNAPPAVAEALLMMAERFGGMQVITGGHLRKILCGGANIRVEVSNKLLRWGIKALGCYGVSECSPCITVNRDDFYKFGSAGVSLGCNQIRIAKDGEIVVKGDNVMLGYYGDPELTNKVIVAGEYYTGDIGLIDEDGFLYIIGRKNNMIVFEDGTKCIPEKLEALIMECPVIKEVLVYAKNRNGSPELCVLAYVEREDMQETARQHIFSISTNHPFSQLEFTQNPLPKTVTGKIRRRR